MSDQNGKLTIVLTLWLGGFLVGLAVATLVIHGFDLTPVLIGGSGSMLSGLALTRMLTQE